MNLPKAAGSKIENIIENLLYVMPVINKKLMRVNTYHISSNIQLTKLHVMIMGALQHNKQMRASEIGREFMILKPQMTRLIRELVDARLVDQIPDVSDKRAKDIVLTEQGNSTLKKFRQLLKKAVSEQLSRLTEEEVDEFSSLLTRLRRIGSILEKRGK